MARASGSARWHGSVDDAEEVREGCEPDLPRALPEQAPREPDGVDDRRGDATPREELDLPVEEGEVEAGVVRDDRRVAGEREQAADGELGAWRSRERLGADPGDGRDGGGKRDPWVDERLERVLELESPNALRPDLADPRGARRETRRLEIDDDEMRVLESDVRARRRREPDRCAAPGKPRVAGDDVVEQRPGERRRRAREGEQRPRRLVGRHRPPPRLDELDEPVGGIERELHRPRSIRERMFACKLSTSAYRTGVSLTGGRSDATEQLRTATAGRLQGSARRRRAAGRKSARRISVPPERTS